MAAKPSLEELLEGVDPSRLSQPCKDHHLSEVALHVTEWRTIAPFLRLKEDDEEQIVAKSPNDLRAKKIAMLRRWREKRGNKATYQELAEVFWKLDKLNLVEEVHNVLINEWSSSESEEEGCVEGSGSQSWTVPRYAGYLKGRYCTTRPPVLSLQWPPPPTRTVFNLALIQKQQLEHGPNEELVRLLQRGKVKEAAESHTEIELSNLMTADDNIRKVILIEGAPGSGKSTLAWHICQQWEKRKLFAEYEVVVFVQLRDLELQSASTLADILPVECTDMAPDIATLLTRSGRWGKGVLLVLDGWDELQPDCLLHSLLMCLIARPTCLNMHFSSVIVTSRPVSSAELQRHASSRVEVLGFKPEEIQEYFKTCFGRDHQLYTKFVDQLRERQVIEASCFLPLNAVIVVHTFCDSDHSLPHTLHGVFERLVFSCIRRHVTDRGKAKNQTNTSCLRDLHPNIQAPLLALSSLAFHGIKINKVVFSKKDLSDVIPAVDVISTLSLVQEVECFRVCGHSKSYNFFHLQIQELLAAYHISKLTEDKQVETFEHLFGQPRFAAVFQFYAAFTKLQARGIREVLVDMMDDDTLSETVLQCVYEAQDPHLCKFVGYTISGKKLPFLSSRSNPLYVIALGYFLCCYCYYCTDVVSITVYNVDMVSINLLVREFLGHQSHISASPSQDGYLAFRFLLSVENFQETLKCASKLLSSLQPFISALMFDIQDSIVFETLLKNEGTLCMLMESSSSLQHCELKNFSGSKVISVNECDFFKFAKFIHHTKGIRSFEIDCMTLQISQAAFKAIAYAMANKSGITHLRLHNCHFVQNDPTKPLIDAIQISNTLKVIDLTGSSLGGYVHVSSLLVGLASNTSVVELVLGGCSLDLTGESGQALCNMLRANTTLKAVNLHGEEYAVYGSSAVDLQAVCVGISLNNFLAYLDLTNCQLTVTEESSSTLSHMLRTNTTLKSLKLDDNLGISNEGAVYLAQGLAQNRGLETLSIVGCGISTAVVELGKALKTNKCLVSLDISYNDVGERFVNIVRSLQGNSNLKHLRAEYCGIQHNTLLHTKRLLLESLDLSGNPIRDEGTKHIAQLVTNSHSLYQLNLGNCDIGDRGAKYLASALERNTSLEILHMPQNKFTDAGLLTLGRSLKRNKALRKLHIEHQANHPTLVGVKHLLLSLCENQHLSYLCLIDGNEVRDEVSKVNQIRRRKNCNILRLMNISAQESGHPFSQSECVP